jgi:hypothetical protein
VSADADASQLCRELLTKLLEAGWEAKAFESLATLLKPRTTAAAAGSSAAAAAAAGSSALAQAAEMYRVVGVAVA